jgi:fructokinase
VSSRWRKCRTGILRTKPVVDRSRKKRIARDTPIARRRHHARWREHSARSRQIYNPPVLKIGIDLGGTKIEGAALDARGAIRARRRIPTPRGDYDATLRAITALIEALEQETVITTTVGIAIPGTISPATGLVKNANSTWLNGRPLAEDLPRLLRRPVRFANDANCFVLSEAVDGAAAGARVVFGVIIGTGTGGGLAIEQRVVTGVNGVAGEWGHNPIPAPREGEWPGPPCYCGRTGCIETFLSGPGLARDYSGPVVDAASIAQLATDGDPAAVRCLERYEERLARALGTIINVVDPDVIVLGGGLSNIERLYSRVPALWAPYVFSDRVDTQLVRAAHGDSSGVRGAAWLWNE